MPARHILRIRLAELADDRRLPVTHTKTALRLGHPATFATMEDLGQPPPLPQGQHFIYPAEDGPSFPGLVVAGVTAGIMLAAMLVVLFLRRIDVAWTIVGAFVGYVGFALTVLFTRRGSRDWLFWVSVVLGFLGLLIVLWSQG